MINISDANNKSTYNSLNQLEINLFDLCDKEDIITLGQIKLDSTISHQIKSELSNLSRSMKIDEIIHKYPHVVTIFLSDIAQSSYDETLFWKDVFSTIQTDEESEILKQKYSAIFYNAISWHTNLLQNSESINFFPFLLLHALFTNETIEKIQNLRKEHPDISEEEVITKIIHELKEKIEINETNKKTEIPFTKDITDTSKSIIYQLTLIALFDTDKIRSNNAKLSLKNFLNLHIENIGEHLISDINQLIYSWDHKDNLETAFEKIERVESSILDLKTSLSSDNITIQKTIQNLLERGPLVEINEILSAIEKIENNNIESFISPINRQLEILSLKIDDTNPSKVIQTINTDIEKIKNRQDEINNSVKKFIEILDFEANSIKKLIEQNKSVNSGLDPDIITEKLDQVYEEILVLKKSIPTDVTTSFQALDGKIDEIILKEGKVDSSISTLNQNLSIIAQNLADQITDINSNITNNVIKEIDTSLEGLVNKIDNYSQTLISNSDNLSKQISNIHTNLQETSLHEIVSDMKIVNDNILKTQSFLDSSLQTLKDAIKENVASLNTNVQEINDNLESSVTVQILNAMQEISHTIIQSQKEFSERIETLNNSITNNISTINEQLMKNSEEQETILNSICELNTNISSQTLTFDTKVDNIGQTQNRVENSINDLSDRLIQKIDIINTNLKQNMNQSQSTIIRLPKNESSDYLSIDDIKINTKNETKIEKPQTKSRIISLKTKVDKNGKKSRYIVFNFKRK
ncbi:MAG TPA: hypothetical protein PK024_08960 [Methanospirillum sp.]|uniref:hypothetical protein n=1 Tax=Methanospirillum sp. TaxID=45200 RepID=UPI002D0A7CBE|nr:hypothetical protein [Methanospirillum sp.]HOJ96946.1 hypothetical protein [Methanospirillum sp.]